MGNRKRLLFVLTAEITKFNGLCGELKLFIVCFGFVFIAMNCESRTL
jgi:hypothetical protein